MPELICIYCKTRNEIDAEVCITCNIPLINTSKTEKAAPYRGDFASYQIAEESSSVLIAKVKAVAVLVLAVCICVVGVILQNSTVAPEQQQLEQERIILDQNVGRVVEMPPQPSQPTKLELAKQLIEQQKQKDAIKILTDIKPEDPDYKQASELLKELKHTK